MIFYKYHGTGNDFIIMDSRSRKPYLTPDEIVSLCDRNTGVGGDGVIFACDALTAADAEMRLFNADGSEAEMSGNGIRCLAKYLYEREGLRSEEMIIDTKGGAKIISLDLEDGQVVAVSVDMGIPDFTKPAGLTRNVLGAVSIPLEGARAIEAVCLSMGNPHCVVFVEDIDRAEVNKLGPMLENHNLFPNRINVGFVQIIDEGRLASRVWERGVGETAACGTGACAAFAAAINSGKAGKEMVISQKGGDLRISVDATGHLHLTGPAVEVFSGELNANWRG